MPGSDPLAQVRARMTPSPADTLLLRAAFGPADQFDNAFDAWSKAVGSAPDLTAYNMLQLLAPRLSGRDEAEPLVALCRRQYRLTWAKARLTERRHGAILAALADHDIPVVIFKGLGFASYYGDPGLRCPGDLDILVAQDDFRKVTAYFHAHGTPVFDHHDPAAFDPRYGHAITYKTTSGDLVDVHAHVFHCWWTWLIESDLLRSATRPISVSGVKCETLSAEHHLILLAEHRFSSMTAGSRWIADTWMIISSGEIDWERLATDAERLGLASITAAALIILRSLGADVPEAPIRALGALKQPATRLVDADDPDWRKILQRAQALWFLSNGQLGRFIPAFAANSHNGIGRRMRSWMHALVKPRIDVR